MVFTFTLDNPSGKTIASHYATSGESAIQDVDYSGVSGKLTFSPGSVEEYLQIDVMGEMLDEFDETFDLNLTDVQNAIITDGAGIGTILNDDDPPIMNINPTVELLEGSSEAVSAVFTFTLSTASGKTITMPVHTDDGTAIGGNLIEPEIDYLVTDEQVVFSPEEILKTIEIPLNPDSACEPNEYFYLDFGELQNINQTTSPEEVTIRNDDTCQLYLSIIQRNIIFTDYFEDNGNWEKVPEQNSDWFYSQGKYHGKHTTEDRNAKSIAPVEALRLNGSYSIKVEVQSQLGSNSGGRGGLLFDYQNNNATYRFVISPRATSGDNWFIQVRNPEENRWDTLGSGRETTHMNTGNGVNLLQIERFGSQIRAYLNNYLLWSGSDNTFVNGQVGLNIGTPDDMTNGEYVEFAFDNFIAGSLP